jgi:hypothetical protein
MSRGIARASDGVSENIKRSHDGSMEVAGNT